jgi:dCTP deaminase
MSVLSDTDIKDFINNNKLSVEPFNENNLTPNGYDLTIDEVYIKKTNQYINEGIANIPPLCWFAISTREFLKIGSTITSQLWIRSSYARKGIMVSFGKVDSGFQGTLTISCFNCNHESLEIEIGERFCQIVFEKLSSSPSDLYDKKSGNYQNQRGIRLHK